MNTHYKTANVSGANLQRHRFQAMASPCEILTTGLDAYDSTQRFHLAMAEVRRLENKYSRYLSGSVLSQINTCAGDWVTVDPETDLLLNFADSAWQLSDGLFDVTSGILRRIWVFDGSDQVPTEQDVSALLNFIGWHLVEREPGRIKLRSTMELDFGGFVKEYAADRALLVMLNNAPPEARILVNLGGDIACNGSAEKGDGWRIGVDNSSVSNATRPVLQLKSGALATSGDQRRYLLKNGVRYSHVLNPKTGWPVEGAPASVTVHAHCALEAGLLSTVALLQGASANTFLQQQPNQFWLHL